MIKIYTKKTANQTWQQYYQYAFKPITIYVTCKMMASLHNSTYETTEYIIKVIRNSAIYFGLRELNASKRFYMIDDNSRHTNYRLYYYDQLDNKYRLKTMDNEEFSSNARIAIDELLLIKNWCLATFIEGPFDEIIHLIHEADYINISA